MKKMILLCALCLFGAGVVFGQAYSDLLYRDWAGLRAYAQVNKTLGDVRPDVVFMGNSITEGWFNQHPEFFQKNNFLGRGIGGQTSSEMLVRFRQDVIELHPQCVAIMAGTNDIAMNNGYIALENTYQNIVSMCELARFNGIKVLLCSVTPCVRYNWRPQVEDHPQAQRDAQEVCGLGRGRGVCRLFLGDGRQGQCHAPGIFARGMPSQRRGL